MRVALLLASALCAPTILASPSDQSSCSAPSVSPSAGDVETIERDVVIIGGGATGTYAGLRLTDQNKSIAIVEISDRLGGHVETFIDPVSGMPVDYGVQAYINNEQTLGFFGRFDVPLANVSVSPLPSKIVDFKTGVLLPNATAVNPTDLIGPLANYLFTTINFNGISEGAYDLPTPVPEDLLMPFGAFVSKYNLTDVLQVVWIFAHGVADLLDTPTLYVLQNFGSPHLLGLSAGYLMPASGGIQQVYDKAAAYLGNSVLFESKVEQTTRGNNSVSVVVQTPNGRKHIKAKKLLVTIPPTIDNLAGFDITPAETALFTQWKRVPYFVGVIRNTGLPDLTSFYNVDLSQATGFPEGKFVWRIETVGVPGYLTVKVVGEPDSDAAQQLVKDAVSRIGKNYGVTTSTTEFAAWGEHKNLQLNVDPAAIAAGFYADLYALQGQGSTFWTGNAWASDYSPLLWAFTEKRVLPLL
ncbi:hypothetical protein NX059_001898 [Plenodomus lindquistii]|nr:hypothetical protein NX059_001898 [Plenodomus lindquistii]